MSRFRTLVISLIISFGSVSSHFWGQTADLILTSGKIITVDEAFSIHTAIAIKDDRILAVGSEQDLQQYRGTSTKMINLQGKTIMPGLMDSHSHAASASVIEFAHPIPTMETIQDVLDYVRSRVKVVKDGEWIWVSQVFLTRLREQRYPTRQELDEAAPRNPVVFRTGPDASVNTLALKLSGIDKNWKVDDGGPGYAEKDPDTGELTGILRSCTRYLKYRSSEKEPTQSEHIEHLKEVLADYNRVGITTLAERSAPASVTALYQGLRDRGGLTVRAYISRRLDTLQPVEKIKEVIGGIARSPLFKGDSMLRVAAVKTALDGGMLTGSAYMRKPWGVSKLYGITDPDYRGLRFIPQDKLVQIVAACMENGVQFTSHCVGDGAVHAFIDACDSLRDRFDIRAKRPIICHSNFMSKEAVQRMAELGIAADIQPAWLHLDARTLNNQFGYERLTWFQPLRALFAAGVIVGGGSDHMQKIGSRRSINFYDPWLAMWVAMTRRARWLDDPLHPEQAISRVQAIRFYTINNAYLLRAEKEVGSLEPGKLADFIVLTDDPLTCSIDRFKDIQVHQTYLGGRLVYQR